MASKIILFGFLFVVVLVSGCVETPTGNVVKEVEKEFFCNPPYIEYQSGKCCLDNDRNGICDSDDLIKKELKKDEVVIEEVVEEEIKLEETCPYDCGDTRVCNPIYTNGELVRWTCT